jgi:DNA-binding MarR family transcriptional regulator
VGEPLNAPLLMFIAYRSAEAQIMAWMVDAGFDDVTLAQARVFARLGPDGTRLTELAEQAQITKQSAGFLVDQLEKAGYVERAADPTDGRARLVRISAKGIAAQTEARLAEADVALRWEKHLGKARMRQLEQTLTLLREITDPYA